MGRVSYYNKGILIGNLVRTPELYASSGVKQTAFCFITLAVQRKWQKDVKADTDYIQLQAWGNTAEQLVKFCLKGEKIWVEYALQSYPKTTTDGKFETVLNPTVVDFAFMDKAKTGGNYEADINNGSPANNGRTYDPEYIDTGDTTEMPFDL